MKTLNTLFILMSLLLTGTSAFSQNWSLVWSDEFTNGIGPDWVFETGGGGWGNSELEYYRRENASVQNGALVITAKREAFGGYNYTSVRMKTQGKKSFKYGKIEARIAMPAFQGVWPAFWMLGDNISSVGWPSCGEIDIMEHINAQQTEYGTIHWNNGGHVEYSGNTGVNNVAAYHTYTVEWDANAIKWFVDGVKFHEASIANSVNNTGAFHNNFFILLNMAIGGNWPGFSVDNNAFPANMYVDYVRVYQNTGGTGGGGGGGTGVATVYKDCNYGGYAIGLPAGDYAYGDLYARGVGNEDISSLKVNAGYEVQLFEHDNFTGASITFNSANSCLVANGWNDRTTSLKIRSTSTSNWSTTIQAENYSAMAGVQTESTTDAGGGLNVGYIDNSDWMAYNNITFPSSGTYKVEYRVASLYGGNKLSLDLNAGTIPLGSVNIPSTGGWQNWTTVSHNVSVNAGTYNLGVFASIGGFNLNWIKITKLNSAKTSSMDEPENTEVYTGSVDLYPNPVNNELNISSSMDLSGSQFQIVDVVGRVVVESNKFSNIDVTNLEKGIYTLVVITPNSDKLTKRFVKQ